MDALMKNIRRNRLMAISIGIVYVWFGALKFFPGLSPADTLAKDTIHLLTFRLIPANVSIVLLALWEVGIGILLLLNTQVKKAILLALVHMVLTFSPLIFFPDLSFNDAPFTLTLVGQYIMKNIIIISALLFIYPNENKSNLSAMDPNFKVG